MNLPKNYTIPAGYMSVSQLAHAWGTSDQAVRYYITRGAPHIRGDAMRNGSVPYYVKKADFEAWVKEYKRNVPKTGRPKKRKIIS